MVAVVVVAIASALFAEDVLLAMFAGWTLVAAVAAAWFILPSYLEWQRQQRARPSLSIRFEIGRGWKDVDTVESDHVTIEGLGFNLRVIVRNDGDAPLRSATLNILVLADCRISTQDPLEKKHYLLPWPAWSSLIQEGERSQVNFTAVERDFPAGGNDYFFHVWVETPKPGEWPVLVELYGDPPPSIERTLIVSTT